MVFLAKFLYRNLKGYRFLVILAIVVSFAQVGSDLFAAMPLKFIPSKVNNPGSDPACTFPFLDPVLSFFDTPLLDPSLRPTQPDQPPGQPPPAPCPATSTDLNSVVHPRITQHSTIGVIVFSLIMLTVFGLLSALLVYIDLYLATFIAQNLSARLRKNLFDHLQRLTLDWHDKQKKGDLVQRLTGNIADIEKLVNDGLVDLLAGILMLVGVAIVMSIISKPYTLLSLTIAPILFLLVLGYTSGIKAAAKRKAKAAGKLGDVATEDIQALPVIRAYTLEKRENKRFGLHVGSYRAAGMRAGRLQAQFTPLVSVLVVFGTIIVVGIGGYVAAGNGFSFAFVNIGASTIDIGTLILFLTYLKMLYQPMRDLSKLTTLASNGTSGAERIQEVLDQAPEVLDSEEPYEGEQKLKGDISFENVFFGYTKERTVLKGINLHIPAGRKVALVGYSGSGKTTLVKLIPRFYQLEQGSIKIDGVENSKYPLHVLRQNISMVLQDSILFEGTIRENLEIGRPGAAMKLIIDAAKKANIHEMIMDLPGGYDTYVREQGNNFSAGQRQRLSIARAILRDSPILILDEPTANLDVEAEAEVMYALNTLIIGRTVLTISHRLSTLGNVDEILVMHHGQIVERGTFKELKRNNGVFANLLKEQNRYSPDYEEEYSVRATHATTSPSDSELVSDTVPYMLAVTPITSSRLPVNGYSTATSSRWQPYASSTQNGKAEDQNGQHEAKASREKDVQNHGGTLTKAQIIVQVDGKITGKYRLSKTIFTIGRYPTSNIQIPSARVSRLHATIRWQNGAWVIQDAESLNGLTCQGQRIDQLALVDGDHIYIDPTIVLHYEELRQ
jgi:ATP-binding cassette subfamily B protein